MPAAGLRVIDLDQKVDGLILHVDFRITQQLTDGFDVSRAAQTRQRGQGRTADHLVAVLQLFQQSLAYRRGVEAAEQVDDVQADQRIFALQAAAQFRHQFLSGHFADQTEQLRLLVGILGIAGGEQIARCEAMPLRLDDLEQRSLGNAGLG